MGEVKRITLAPLKDTEEKKEQKNVGRRQGGCVWSEFFVVSLDEHTCMRCGRVRIFYTNGVRNMHNW